ncbi:hypothetical protein [Pelomicrobium methylotrophicum]|uniref:Uncharacterized protein n=1 Tax=Pelomicrobium methylotrophicum TaxID=2602750 RepID=A0A5C7EUI3_9PROT|nr:hypothetical protein [Pelomicrobium methylotrophicum]TXF11902.1 hypothetical protein FR698_07805 [Pelomicrobium methylotrophicum]
MQYCYMDSQDKLVAVIERMGNGSAKSPVRWLLRWAVRQGLAGLEDSVYGDRWEAAARVLRVCPDAALKVFNRRGERLR